MASSGVKDVTIFTGEPEDYSEAIRRAGDELLKCFRNLRIGVVCVNGYKGVGRWRIVEYAARMLNESYHFQVQILVKLQGRDFSERRVQMEIESQLGLTANPSTDNDENLDGTKFSLAAAANIRKSLADRRFLLIVGVTTDNIDLETMGIPLWSSAKDTKVFQVSDGKKQRCDATINLEELSIDMLHEEATQVAHSPSFKGWFTPKEVVDCCLYLWFFFRERFEGHSDEFDVKRLARNWIAEGFITGGGTGEEEEGDQTLEKKACALFRELELRSLVTLAISREGSEPTYWHLNDVPDSVLTSCGYHIQVLKNIEYRKLSTLQIGLIENTGEFVFKSVIPDSFFQEMEGLRVLHLYYLHIKSLPTSITTLHNLRLLRIHSCKYLQSLPPSFKDLDKLEFLELYQSSSLESIADECFHQKTNLRFLLLHEINCRSLPSSVSKLHNLHQLMLTNSKSLMEIPEESFEYMKQLRVLDLSGDSNLKSLPSSLSKLINLRRLILSNCSSLRMNLLPHLQQLPALEELDLCSCNSLEGIDVVSSSLGTILPNLRMLNLSKIEAIRQVSLNGYRSLESVFLNWLENLEELSISGTKIKSFPENLTGTDRLRRLDMLHMNHISEIKWDAISDKLEDLNINQCGTLNSLAGNDERPENIGGARIRLNNHRFLRSIAPSSKVWGAKCFSNVHIFISACQEDEQQWQFVYANNGSNNQACRHLEIQGGGNTFLTGIDGVLSRMELFTLSDNLFVKRLSDLVEVTKLTKLKECRVKRCEQMEILFEGGDASFKALRSLERIWMSNLVSLRSVCSAIDGRFIFLKHIYLEYCPIVTFVFSSGIGLQSLETLQIKFCNKLEAVFQGEATAQGSLQLLQTVCLWELPMLESICNGVRLPALKKLIVSGCEKLNKLPLGVPPADVSASNAAGGSSLEVEGDLVWWDNLKLVGESIKHRVHFKERRPLTTHDSFVMNGR